MKHSFFLLTCLFVFYNTSTASGPPESIHDEAHHLVIQCTHKHNKQRQKVFIDPQNQSAGLTVAVSWMQHMQEECIIIRQSRKRTVSKDEIKGEHLSKIITTFFNESD